VGHVTEITSHTGGGLPETIVDANGVTTTLTYTPRQWPLISVVSGPTGGYTTTWSYDEAGNLLQTTYPDGSFIRNTFDSAHRLIQVTDPLGSTMGYTLDALGDRTLTVITPKSATNSVWHDVRSFDALGRLLVDTQGAGQSTTKTYDPNGNVLSLTDGLTHTTTNAFDALDRLTSSTDPNGGTTATAYDAHDRIVSITDANGNQTSYLRNGFGDVIQLTSPDSGVSVMHYDGDSNLSQKIDALGTVTNQTFDPLDRVLTTTYPADSAENVTYTYDQTGTGFSFGVGRLTSVVDAAGSLTKAYEERGNLEAETRVSGKTTLTTGYTYDRANRMSSITYPDGTVIGYQYDAGGYATTVTAQLPGASSATTIATMQHLPFGPLSSMNFGNGTIESWSFDTSYRPTSIMDALSGTNLQKLTYAYDAANNVTAISDGVNAANSQTLSYDADNRLTGAASGTGGYGSYAWTYDKVGNRLTQVQPAATITYSYSSGSNRLATITTVQASALMRPARKLRLDRGQGDTLWAHGAPGARIPNASTQPLTVNSNAHGGVAILAGLPMVLIGLAGIIHFRRRLHSHKFFTLVFLSAIAGGAGLILNGCGGGGGSGGGGSGQTTQTATPTYSPASGTYSAIQSVTISDSIGGATIYYTTDGTTPTTNSTKYSGPIGVSSSETIDAVATATGYSTSAVGTATYTINLPAAATPTFSPAAGTYTSVQTVTISDSTSGATIYYTTNGTTPTTSSTKYSSAIAVSSSETIEAIATASGYSSSAVGSATYTLSLPAVVTVTTNANGNITSIPPADGGANATFTYNNANRVASVTGSPLAATFIYDWAGHRFSKTNPGAAASILYTYGPGGTLLSENDNGILTDYVYVDGRPIAVLHPGAVPSANQVSYIVADRLGVPQLASNNNGSTVWSTSYQPFGTTGNVNAAITQNLRLPGQYADAETGFSYNEYRDYMPGAGRYLETDPLGLVRRSSTYSYAEQSPDGNVDPEGLFSLSSGLNEIWNLSGAADEAMAGAVVLSAIEIVQGPIELGGTVATALDKVVPGPSLNQASVSATANSFLQSLKQGSATMLVTATGTLEGVSMSPDQIAMTAGQVVSTTDFASTILNLLDEPEDLDELHAAYLKNGTALIPIAAAIEGLGENAQSVWDELQLFMKRGQQLPGTCK
jgi:RHS repeat-associated protein